ncbi:efflux RND transporter periplasmic adaptor subunit [Dyella nitratireducens]|uniref:Transport system membrane protein n=1 Tax=Dyella nitratireducens TaxID=1849580 RepID=A0ABQ1GMY1_9GAMM|nr:efflux RND transporter periplasmic adaptor subunit [Dyella nitratireducens]GGA46673.1 transport system membrane protein [Dyella nitratireducens]GLQ41480.1 transport system membrane protein [Dyella nitratireducens]
MSADTPRTAGHSRSKRGLWIGVAIAVVVIALVVFHLLNRPAARTGSPAQVVSVATAKQGDMPEIINSLGTVTPLATVTVLPQLSGYLTEVAYQEGQDVKKGQFLAQIDPRQYEISKEQAQAQLAKDQATLDQARTDLARYTQLYQKKSIAEQTYMDQKFLVQQYEAAVKADQANIAQFELDLTYCHIIAPVDGKVGLRLVDPGNYVTPSSSTGIVVITTMKPTTVQFTVPQNLLGKVLDRYNTGTKLPVTVFNSDNTKQIATGTLYAISNQMATSTGTVTLRATVPNDNEALYPNEFVNAQLLVDTLQNTVLVPTPAVQTGAPGNYVFLVNSDDTVSVHKVTPGPSDGKYTAILAGLSVGETVVTDGTDRLSDGAKIRVAQAHPAGASSAGEPASSSSTGASHTGGKRRHKTGSDAGSTSSAS